MKISGAGSFDGWELKKWFTGNWSTVKEIVKVGIPLLVSLVATDNLALRVLITGFGKLAIDAGEFYFKKVTLS